MQEFPLVGPRNFSINSQSTRFDSAMIFIFQEQGWAERKKGSTPWCCSCCESSNFFPCDLAQVALPLLIMLPAWDLMAFLPRPVRAHYSTAEQVVENTHTMCLSFKPLFVCMYRVDNSSLVLLGNLVIIYTLYLITCPIMHDTFFLVIAGLLASRFNSELSQLFNWSSLQCVNLYFPLCLFYEFSLISFVS